MNTLIVSVGVFTLYLLLGELTNLFRSVSARNWKTAQGKLKNWSIRHDSTGEAESFEISHLSYSYEHSGNSYESTRIGYGFPSKGDAMFVEKFFSEVFKDAPNLVVYHHPKYPSISTLAVGFRLYQLPKISLYSLALLFLFAGYGES